MKEILLRIAIAQVNLIVGDIEGNFCKIKRYISLSKSLDADIVCFPELSLTGYPPEDLLIKPKFIRDNIDRLGEIVKASGNIAVIAGFVDKDDKGIYNAAAIIYDGKIRGVYRKNHLPNYGVFDEIRYFRAGTEAAVFDYKGVVFGVNICEDIWYLDGPLKSQAEKGARLIININSSPFYAGKVHQRQKLISRQAKENNSAIVYANLVGGQDELVFDGQSMVADARGRIIARAKAFKEQLLPVDVKLNVSAKKALKGVIRIPSKPPCDKKLLLFDVLSLPLSHVEEIYEALILGLRDYVIKNGFKKAVIGLSGGIDSALVAALAVDALGKDNVTGVFMPSCFTSNNSRIDARQLAVNLGIELLHIPIENIYKVYLRSFKAVFHGVKKDTTEENLQARIRGNILMAFSNKFGWLVLATGNKSEMSVGYATLYGDMAGGFAVIKDVPKTMVYDLVKYRNSRRKVVPERIIVREPTAELKANQKDRDTLPEYNVLDPILKAYIEEDKDFRQIISLGFNPKVVRRVLAMVDKSEYKRRQAPPGVKITPKAFGRDRRMPLTNKFTG